MGSPLTFSQLEIIQISLTLSPSLPFSISSYLSSFPLIPLAFVLCVCVCVCVCVFLFPSLQKCVYWPVSTRSMNNLNCERLTKLMCLLLSHHIVFSFGHKSNQSHVNICLKKHVQKK